MTLDAGGNFTASGNITAGGQFIGNGVGLTNLPAAQLTGDVAAARIANAINASGAAPIYACRAWVNFNGTGTVAIRASGNVSSITDNGVGDYTINFTTAMPDANYAITGTCNTNPSHPVVGVSLHFHAESFVRVLTGTSGGSNSAGFVIDPNFVLVAIFR